MDNSLTVWSFFSLFWLSESLSWTIKQPDSVYRGSPITLEWTISLTKEEKKRADRFSLILLEREKFLYSNQWQIMAVKQYYNGIYQEIDDEDTFDVIPGKDMALKLNNVTDTDASRFRCTFLSSFASPKSIIEVEIEDSPVYVRLMDGTTPNKGRVEVYRNGFWGTICRDGWDILDASVVCRMLGYAGAWKAGCCEDYRGGTGPVWLSEISCTGREKSLLECDHSGWGVNNCDHRKDAEIVCYSPPTEKPSHYVSLKIVSTRTQKSLFSSTKAVTSTTAQSILTQVSPPTPFSPTSIEFQKSSTHTVRVTEAIVVSPSSSSLAVMSSSVIAPLNPILYIELLNGGGHPNQGRVSLYYNGQWGTICQDHWDMNDANVVCRMLGYPGAFDFTNRTVFGSASDGPIWLDDVNCTGIESTLAACPHAGWGKSNCDHTKDVGVKCDFNYTVKAKDASCSFDTWYCGWENGPGSKGLTWTRKFGPTISHETGPSQDHTSGSGFYFYIEASGRSRGEVASLVSPHIRSDENTTCMVFFYHMYGQSIATLTVKVEDQVLWQLSGNQGNAWYRATVPLNFNATYRVMFEGVVGSTARSDIAIDDVEFQENTECEKTAETLVPPKIIWISPNRTAELGSEVTLVCTVTGLPTPLVVWKKNGKLVSESQVTGNVTLLNITQSDIGSYECWAINDAATDMRATALNVLGSPRKIVITTNVSCNAAILGDSVAIRCWSRGYPAPLCGIYRDGNLLSANGGVYVIENFTSLDQGVYICNCSNVAGAAQANFSLTLYESPAIHTIHPAYQLVNETDTFEFFCNATGNPPPTITWRKVGDTRKVHSIGQTLIIHNAYKSDFGSYRCTAMSVRGENVSAVARVEINNFSPTIEYICCNVTVLEKERRNVTMSCNATGRPAAQLSWIRVADGKTLVTGNTLVISAAGRSHRGEYRCVGDNGVRSPVSKSAYVNVLYNPITTRLTTDKLNAVVLGNGRIAMTCITDANPPPSQYQFYRNGVYLRTSFTGVHVIHKARYFDAGTYLCVPLNRLGSGSNGSVKVSVFGAFSIMYFPQNMTVNESASVSFFCNATSYAPYDKLVPQISWSKLRDNSKVFPPGQQFVIRNVSRYDGGTYICTAKNGLGLPDTKAAVLSVLHKPYDTKLGASVPDNIAVLNSSVIITCRAKANPPVITYNIYHNGILVSNASSGIYNITHALTEDNGSYVCVPYNEFGEGEKAALNVSFVGPCGVKRVHHTWSPQIVGGAYAKPGEWPWQIQLGYFDNTESIPHLCGGSILDHYWIVTAAHCVKSEFGKKVPANFNVTAGELHRGVSEGREQTVPVKKIILHQNFDQKTLRNDIALMKLQRPIFFDAHVSPICLPDFDFDDGTKCYVTGWGRSGPLSSTPDILQETSIPLVAHRVCQLYYKQKRVNNVTSDMRCAGTLGQSRGTCKGDSGGPLACERDDRWYLMGVTSWANEGCMHNGDPGVFSDVLYFRSWIEEVMKNNTKTAQ